MSRVERVEEAVKALDADELAEFRGWFAEYDWAVWDQRLAVRMAEREELFRLAFEDAPIGMVLTSLDRRLIQVNTAFAPCSVIPPISSSGGPIRGCYSYLGAGLVVRQQCCWYPSPLGCSAGVVQSN